MKIAQELQHHGIKGMHWGVRRFQNADGTLTSAGRQRYDTGYAKSPRKIAKEQKKYDKQYKKNYAQAYNRAASYLNQNMDSINKKWEKEFKGYSNWADSPKYEKYAAEINDMFKTTFNQSMEELIGKRPA